MAKMSIKRQMQAIEFFKELHNEPIAMSSVKYHKLIITNIAVSSSFEMEELNEIGFHATIFAAEEWEGFFGLEFQIREIKK